MQAGCIMSFFYACTEFGNDGFMWGMMALGKGSLSLLLGVGMREWKAV